MMDNKKLGLNLLGQFDCCGDAFSFLHFNLKLRVIVKHANIKLKELINAKTCHE